MIAYAVSFGSLRVEDMDAEGCVIRDTDGGHVWLSHEQIELVARLSAFLNRVNA